MIVQTQEGIKIFEVIGVEAHTPPEGTETNIWGHSPNSDDLHFLASYENADIAKSVMRLFAISIQKGRALYHFPSNELATKWFEKDKEERSL